MFTHGGITYIQPKGWFEVVKLLDICVILLIPPTKQFMEISSVMIDIIPEVPRYVIPVIAAEAHIVEAVRIPRIRVYNSGKKDIDKIVYGKEDIVAILKDAGLIKGI